MAPVIPINSHEMAQARGTLGDIPPEALRGAVAAARSFIGGPDEQARIADIRAGFLELSPEYTPELADAVVGAFMVVARGTTL